jgi:hypothetical protein
MNLPVNPVIVIAIKNAMSLLNSLSVVKITAPVLTSNLFPLEC